MVETKTTQDLIQVIQGQHAEIRELFKGAMDDPGRAFDALVRLLAVHETAEEMVVYPAVGKMGGEAANVVAARKKEEDAAKKARPVLLEPVMRVEVVVPKDYLGDVMGDLASRRGRIQSQEDRGGTQIISARVPLSEMFGYATELRSRTQGRATYSMHFDRYEQAPPNVSSEVVERVQGRKS